ncbi:MAG TPA: CHRD domain-containing protein [Ignavibacteriaceae bacterium]|nr:CHRD domain-containing protein [Ignavibacteriaceae bacterium]
MSRWISLLLFSLFFIPSSYSQIMFTAKLDGNQETPSPVSTPATGTAWAVLSPDMRTLTFHLTYAQLDSTFTMSHFHIGAEGIGGPVIHAITSDFVGNTASGEWTNLPDSILTKLFRQEIYLNVHSAKHPGGEIRGQLIPVDDGIGFTAAMDGNQETPSPIVTNATGTGWAVLKNKGTEIDYSVTIAGLSSNLTMAHFHNGPAGVGGPVVHPITFTDSTSTGSWTGYADSIITQMLLNRLYFNVHSNDHPGGEIRGQLIHQGEIMFSAVLNGANETPNPVTTTGNGTAWAVLSGDKSTLYYHVTYAQLDSPYTMSHFHYGKEGVGGPVVKPITFSGNTASGSWTGFPDSVLSNLVKEEIYVNVHSMKNPGGEIRGQLLSVGGIGFTSSLDGNQEAPTAVTTAATGTGWAVLKNQAADIDYNITIAGLSSNLTMAHFHYGPKSVGGPVIHPITFTDSSSSGTWNGFADSIVAQILLNNLYFNVHSTDHPGGEIRGQIEFSNIISGNVPVELTSFSASMDGKNVLLSWTTATETNNLGFDIEKQIGTVWQKIGFVKGKGTTTNLQSYSFSEKNISAGRYSYRLKQIDFDGSFEYSSVINVNVGTPLTFRMSQNYPNPFNPSTIINFQIPERTNVSLKVFDILGREVLTLLDEVKEPGIYNVTFNAAGFSSGVYIYRLSTGTGNISVKKMTLIK